MGSRHKRVAACKIKCVAKLPRDPYRVAREHPIIAIATAVKCGQAGSLVKGPVAHKTIRGTLGLCTQQAPYD